MHTARDVADAIEAIAPLDSGVESDQLGFIHGKPASPIAGVACMWNAHTRSLAAAAEGGLDMVVCHEALWMPPQTSAWYPPVAALGIAGLSVVAREKFFQVNRLPEPLTVGRLKEIVQHGLSFGQCRLFGDGRKPITQPPGKETFAFLRLASKGPRTHTEALILRTRS